MPGTLDLTGEDAIVRDDDYELVLPFVDGSNEPFPVDEYTFAAQIRREPNGRAEGELIATFDIDDSDAAAGTIVLSLDRDTTRDIGDDVGCWDLQVTTVDGAADTWLKGTVDIEGDVTRDEEGS